MKDKNPQSTRRLFLSICLLFLFFSITPTVRAELEVSIKESQAESNALNSRIWNTSKLCQQKVAAAKTGASGETTKVALDRAAQAEKASERYNK